MASITAKRRIRIYPYNQRSRSAHRLAAILHGKVLRKDGSRYIPGVGDLIINWGSSECPEYDITKVLNRPSRVATAANKAKAFALLQEAGVSVPAFATDKSAVSWKGATVVRHKLTGHSGEGIEIIDVIEGKELPDAPLYVQYIKKKDEYRVHVIGDKVALIQRKARRNDVPEESVNWKVRNHSNGFIFSRNEISPPSGLVDAARQAIVCLGLDFGAVDVIWNEHEQRCYVLEVNCAPGMEGSTINDYADGFKAFSA